MKVLKISSRGNFPSLLSTDLFTVLSIVSTCSTVEFRCADGTCIPRSARCNQNMDCADASDEKDCSKDCYYLLFVHG